jgi:hypothetical protein
MNDDHKKKIAEALKRSWTPERREALRQKRLGAANPFFGKTHTEEVRKQFSEQASGERNPFHGKKHDEATRERLSEQKQHRAIRLYKYGITDEIYAERIAAGFKWCGRHKDFLPSGQFSPSAKSMCRDCQSANAKKWRADNLSEQQAKGRAAYANNREQRRQYAKQLRAGLAPEERKRRTRKNALRTKYGVTQQWYVEQLAKQNGVCAICGEHAPTGKYAEYMAIDHDHQSGKPRGILCGGCNTGIGWLDKAEWVPKAMRYLQQFI